MALIYLLRHGETAANRKGRLQGRSDSALTLRGVAQMRAIADLLALEVADPARIFVVSSPLGRARPSAAIIGRTLGLDAETIRCDSRLTEYSFRRWEGLLVGEVEAAVPGTWAQREADRWHFTPPGGESYAMVAERVGD